MPPVDLGGLGAFIPTAAVRSGAASPARQPIWGTTTAAASWRSPGLIKPATNTHADCVQRIRLHRAAFLLAPPAGAAYVRRTQRSSPTHASTRLMDSHIQQMKYTLFLLALLSLCSRPAPGRASPRLRAHKQRPLMSRP
jgi:hypothetical protein